MFSKVEVNGSNVHAVFQYLKSSLPFPSDEPDALMAGILFLDM
jgi:glutathione peroxidase-family protein